jgi:hypothetical protein
MQSIARRFLVKSHRQTLAAYQILKGKPRTFCSVVAIEVAKRLLAEGKKPKLLWISQPRYESDDSCWYYLTPRLFDGEFTWACHIVCAVGGVVYDPLIGTPLRIETYLQRTFIESLEAEVRELSLREVIASEARGGDTKVSIIRRSFCRPSA